MENNKSAKELSDWLISSTMEGQDAWMEGWEALKKRIGADQNPYSQTEQINQFNNWLDGWLNANAIHGED